MATAQLREAATLKAAAKRAVRELDALLSSKSLPKDLRGKVSGLKEALKKKWADLADEAKKDPKDDDEEKDAKESADEGPAPIGEYRYTYVNPGTLSFAALDADAEAQEIAEGMQARTDQFNALVSNIMFSAEVEDKATALEELTAEFIGVLALVPSGVEGDPEELTESWQEDASGGVLAVLNEVDEPSTNEENVLCLLEIAVIEPGWGNTRDNYYYAKDMLHRDASVFNGAKMYLTNHDEEDHTVRNEVSQVVACPVRFTETGAPVARVAVYDRDFAYSVRRRNDAGTLGDLKNSIFADGLIKEGFVEGGREGKAVKKITTVKSIDWVPRAGAGGRALRLVENEEGAQGMSNKNADEKDVTAESLAEAESDAEKKAADLPSKVEDLTTVVIMSEILAADLPRRTGLRLVSGEYATLAELQGAIKEAAAEVKEIVEDAEKARRNDAPSSRAFGMTEDGEKPNRFAEAEKDAAPLVDPTVASGGARAILRRYGVTGKWD